ncbi:expressed unknown protein [Seminavis robusta]|uniref:Uncharacterized protein n=1 Tax=Seminavis robusta TaxID=568900 RepID=A0A9N8DBY2_9STRA|nr:expressed unknown protein [Seminavis robusta]|eukprot:Sro77_g042280.1 n/a (102) ;mRNA; f:126652-127089
MTDATELEKRVEALEVGAKFDATQKDVKELEQEFLAKFQEIREAMVSQSNTCGASGGGASSKEMEAVKAENQALKKRNAKLEYRVKIMLKSMEELYANKNI